MILEIASQAAHFLWDRNCSRRDISFFLGLVLLYLRMVKSSFRSCYYCVNYWLKRKVTGESCRFIPAKNSWKVLYFNENAMNRKFQITLKKDYSTCNMVKLEIFHRGQSPTWICLVVIGLLEVDSLEAYRNNSVDFKHNLS